MGQFNLLVAQAARLRNCDKSLHRRGLPRKNGLVEITTLWPGARNELEIGQFREIFRVRVGVTWAWGLAAEQNFHVRDVNGGSGFGLQWFTRFRGSRVQDFKGWAAHRPSKIALTG